MMHAPSRTGADRRAGATRPARSLPVGELVFALIMLALGVFAFVGVFTIHIPVGGRIGPTVFPLFVSVLLLASAVAVVVGIFRGKRVELEDSEDIDPTLPTDWLTIAKLVGALIAHLVLIEFIGWAPAAAILFGLVAWSLGAKRWWLAFAVGAVLALIVQIVFGGLLGLSLPWGPALGWLGGMF